MKGPILAVTVMLAVFLAITWCFDAGPFDNTVRIHITYNSITDGRSRWVEGDKFYVMGMTHDNRIYRCSVSQQFWTFAPENKHYSLPKESCQEIKP